MLQPESLLTSTITSSTSTEPSWKRHESASVARGSKYANLPPPRLAQWIRHPPFPTPRSRSPAARKGYRFQDEFLWSLSDAFGFWSFPSRWILWYGTGEDRPRYAQMDGLVLFPEDRRALLIECKLSHTVAAVDQLRLYSNLFRLLAPSWKLFTLEVCKNYDPCVGLPRSLEPHSVRRTESALGVDRPLYPILLWKGP